MKCQLPVKLLNSHNKIVLICICFYYLFIYFCILVLFSVCVFILFGNTALKVHLGEKCKKIFFALFMTLKQAFIQLSCELKSILNIYLFLMCHCYRKYEIVKKLVLKKKPWVRERIIRERFLKIKSSFDSYATVLCITVKTMSAE